MVSNKFTQLTRGTFSCLLYVCMLVVLQVFIFGQTKDSSSESVSDIAKETVLEYGEFKGIVINNDDPISFANIIVKEINLIEYTDENGEFHFSEIPVGKYTLLIIADGYVEKEYSIDIVQGLNKTLEFQLADSSDENVFQGDEIIITAERFKNSNSGKKVFDRETLDKLPLTGDDPTSVITMDTGVIAAGNNRRGGGPDSMLSNTTGQVYSITREYSLYGGDTGWNRYFYGNIQIPTNSHPSNPNTSIITREAVNTVTSYKGLTNGIYGQGLGGIVVMEPRKDKNNFLLLGISPTDPSVTFNYWITERINIFVSSRYSLAEYTVVPIINWIVDSYFDDADINVDDYKYGDAIVAMSYGDDINTIDFVTLGFFDINTVSVNINIPENDNVPARILEANVNNYPTYIAAGVSWESLIGDKYKHTLSTYVSNYNSGSDSAVDFSGGSVENLNNFNAEYSYYGYVNALDSRLIDHFEILLSDTSSVVLGGELQYLQVKGAHHDYFDFNFPALAVNSTNTTEFGVEENIFRLYGFTEYLWNYKKLETSITLGVSQVFDEYTDITRTFPSGRIFSNYNFSEKWKLSFSGSISPSFLEGSKYADRLISEEIVNYPYSERTTYTKPTYGIVILPKLIWQITDAHQLFLEPFFGYYFNFHGLHPGLSVSNVEESSRGYEYITPSKGISSGSSVQWDWSHKFNNLSISYTLSYVIYETDDYGWIHSNNDYRHQLKYSYTYQRFKKFQLGVSGNILFDVAFTPSKIKANDQTITQEEYRSVAGDPYSSRSYIPSYDLYVNLKGTVIERRKWDLTYRVQPGDLLSMFVLSGDKVASEYDGATNADLDNRTFTYEFQPYRILEGMFFSIKVSITLP